MTVSELIDKLEKIQNFGYEDYPVIHSHNLITDIYIDDSSKRVVLTGVEESE